MNYNDNKTSFDKLVAGLSAQDRTAMLERINKSTVQNIQIINPEQHKDNFQSLKIRLNNESFFYKIILYIRSLFQKNPQEKIYNDDLIADLARKINRNHPGIVNHKIKSLDYLFYERLVALKEMADFFRPYFSFVNENPGDFYVFLSSFVAPEIAETINSKADPFSLPFTKEATSETRAELVRSLDSVLKDINPSSKANLYSSIVACNWLNNFVSLPYLHFLAQFTNVAGTNYTAPYKSVITDFNEVASVYEKCTVVPIEVFEALYLFSQRKNLNDNVQDKDIERATREFLGKANTSMTAIQSFISEMAIPRLGRVISGNYDWEAGPMEGAEGWFPLFRAQWRKILDIRWNEWTREKKIEGLGEQLREDFDLSEFPVMPFRPWRNLWMPVSFSCELTGGFLAWFAQEKFDELIMPLNLVAMEGIFLKSENRTEYSEALNCFSTAINNMQTLIAKLSPSGNYGHVFQDFAENKLHTMQVQNQINAMMADTEGIIYDAIKNFGRGARSIESIFHGIFDESKDGVHEGLQNLTTIRGRENSNFRSQLQSIRQTIKKALFYISELEPIDSVS